MGHEGRIKNWKLFGIILLVMLAILAVVITCSYRMASQLEEQLNRDLEDEANRNVVALRNHVNANYLLVKTLAAGLEELGGSKDAAIQNFDVFVKEYGLKRIACCSADGMTHSTDGVSVDLSYREFYQRGMQGLGTITEILEDAMDERHGQINIMSVPMYDAEGNIDGVFGVTYESQTFNDTLRVKSFDGQGYNCILNEDGQIMVTMGSSQLTLSANLFSDVLEADGRNGETIRQLKNAMAEKREGSGKIRLEKQENYYYGMPVSLMDGDVNWYVLTIVPASYLKGRVAPMVSKLYMMSFAVVFCMLFGIVMMIIFSRKQQERMRRLAYVDTLTGGRNYASFCLELNGRKNRRGYLVAMDIMNFNNINIASGHMAGDAMLKKTWDILDHAASREELLCRVGGDEFALYLKAENDDTLVDRMEEISAQMNQLAGAHQVWGVHARYGIYRMDGSKTAEGALERAQVAKEFARKNPKARHAFYDEEEQEKRRMDRQIEDHFGEALENHEFEVWYQPKYAAEGGALVGSEALVRWRKQDGSMISPGRFIPLLEENGMIVRLDEYMFREVCRQQKKWLEEGRQVYPVSVNLSRASLFNSDIVERYKKILTDEGISSRYIQVEVTESAMEGEVKIAELLEEFRRFGICILMDDFGAGYSSLSTLNMKCFDTLKLDKSLVDHIGEQDGETLLYHVIHMGQKLGLHITAEGVENPGQLEYLRRMKCDDIQGFLFAKPMAGTEYEQVLKAAESGE